jgi:chromosome segregation ATPase
MKTLVVILGAALVILCGVLYMNSSQAKAQNQKAVTEIASLSNQVTELSTRLVLEGVKATDAQSLASSNLALCVRQLAALSNTQTHAKAQLASTQDALQKSQADTAARQAQLDALQPQLAAAQANVELLNAEVLQLAPSRKSLVAAQQKISELTAELGVLRVQFAELSKQVEDPGFLRLQSEKARDLAKLRKRQAEAKPDAPPDKRAPLVLLPDGTVQFVSTPTAPQP